MEEIPSIPSGSLVLNSTNRSKINVLVELDGEIKSVSFKDIVTWLLIDQLSSMETVDASDLFPMFDLSYYNIKKIRVDNIMKNIAPILPRISDTTAPFASTALKDNYVLIYNDTTGYKAVSRVALDVVKYMINK